MDSATSQQKIVQAVRASRAVLLVIHQQPDADALGSLAAFADWLDTLAISYTAYCKTLSPSVQDFAYLFDPDVIIVDPAEILRRTFDLIIVFDSGDLAYAGANDLIPQLPVVPIINIDHHATNQQFGTINLTTTTAASTTEILYDFFEAIAQPLTPHMATALLAGIIFDTGTFTNQNTTHRSLHISSRLLAAGAKLPHITTSMFKNKTVELLKLWGVALERLRHHQAYNVVTTVLTQDDLVASLNQTSATEGVANFLNNLAGVNAVLILQQLEAGVIKGSLRTNNDLIDVAKLATLMGGGGHRKAAGFKLNGTLEVDSAGQWQII